MTQRKCKERLKLYRFCPVMNGTEENLRIAFVDGSVPPPTQPTSPFLIVRSSPFKKRINRDGCGSEPVRVVLGVLAPSQTRRRRVSLLKYRFLFELKLCNPRTGCDVVVNHWAVCLSLLRDVFDRMSSFFYVVSVLRQRVSMCPFGGGRILVWMCCFVKVLNYKACTALFK